jgi:hypothetical protein
LAFVAIYTVGRLKHPNEHPASREFFEVGNEVIRQAAKTGHLIKEFSSNRVLFPENAIKGEGFPILTLTVWKSLQSLLSFYLFRPTYASFTGQEQVVWTSSRETT